VSQYSGKSKIPVVALTVIVGLEAIGLAVTAGLLLFATLTQRSDSLASAIFLDLLVLGFAAAMVVVTIGVWRGVPSARSGALVWQVLQLALGLASDDGVFARPDIALAFGVPAVVAIVLILFNRSVREHFSDRDGLDPAGRN
jgi:hypothetical protein